MVAHHTAAGSADQPPEGERSEAVTRRRVLAAATGAVTFGLAGCSGVTSQSFTASPIRLPEGVAEELGLAELFTESPTTTRALTIADQDVEVTITNQFAGYGRSVGPSFGQYWGARRRPPLVQRFVSLGAEATPGSGAAINALASDLGFDEATPEFVEGDTPVPGDRVTLVIPERARQGGEVRLGELMAIQHAADLPVEELTSRGGNNYLVELPSILPDRRFRPAPGDYEPDGRWVAGHEGHWIPENPTQLRCLVCLGEQSPASLFGVDEMPGRRLDEGETVATEDTILFSPAPKENPTPDPGVMDAAEVFDAGHPTPMGGPTYGLGLVATPNAEVLGESVNPLAQLETSDLLTSDRVRGVLADAGLTDADEIEWLRGPKPIQGGRIWSPADSTTLLGEDVGLELHGGVVSGRAGPWAVALHVARVSGEDVDIAVAMHRRPVGTADARPLVAETNGFLDRRWTKRAIDLTGALIPSLERVDSGE